jgi:intraflagellar transport protein 46
VDLSGDSDLDNRFVVSPDWSASSFRVHSFVVGWCVISVDTAVAQSRARPPAGKSSSNFASGGRGDSPPRAVDVNESRDSGSDDAFEIPGENPAVTRAPAPAAAQQARSGAAPSVQRPGGPPPQQTAPQQPAKAGGNVTGSMLAQATADSDDTSEEDDDGEDSSAGLPKTGCGVVAVATATMFVVDFVFSGFSCHSGYNPADFAHLNVTDDVRDLFQYIGRYKPHNIALETKLKCFIPDYIPAIGEIDAFLKIDRPDGKPEVLGLKKLDEPSTAQSDPTVLDLQLRAVSKTSSMEPTQVRCIEHADKNPKDISKWIQSISDLHRSKPLPQVYYSKPMPDIERLMQLWPPEFEDVLKTAKLPSAAMDMSLQEYVRTICSLVDIPVHPGGSAVQSLHVLFTLYSEFKNNPHFGNLGGNAGSGEGEAGRFVCVLCAFVIVIVVFGIGSAGAAGATGDGANVMTF